ncbi:IS3 family transposase [Ekhidna sp.]|uniref:IS3 family transposase n=1 Tax=Ekhidna sp. TaxID=2608089 RepID=UPI003CCC2189
MKQVYPSVGLDCICGLFGMSRQSYYQYQARSRSLESTHQQILQLVLEQRALHPHLGGRKLFHMLQSDFDRLGIRIGRDAFFDLLSSHHLLIKRKKRRVSTTNSRHWFRKYPNLIKGLDIQSVNQVWVSDITYWKWRDRFHYICLITDAYSRKIVGYELSDNLEAINNQRALHMAIESQPEPLRGLIHHSDRGIQYCSQEYVDMLSARGILISMTENRDPLENAIAERINGILKEEYLNHYEVENMAQARELLSCVVNRYNQGRPHLSCGMKTPDQVHSTNSKPKPLWKNYWKNTTVNIKQDYNQTVNICQD